MKKLTAALMLATALATPELAFAKSVTLDVQMANYSGPNAYLAIYLAKPDGSYDSTIWVAGQRMQFYRHLRGWLRGISAAGGNIDGITGASIGSGRSFQLSLDLADAMIDAGYTIHVDSAVEEYAEYPDNIIAPVSSANSGAAVAGRGFVKSLTVNM